MFENYTDKAAHVLKQAKKGGPQSADRAMWERSIS